MNYKDINKALEDSKSLNEYFDSIALEARRSGRYVRI